jgi:hypothetical protein
MENHGIAETIFIRLPDMICSEGYFSRFCQWSMVGLEFELEIV